MPIPPHRLAAIDQDMAELDKRLEHMVSAIRDFDGPRRTDVDLFLIIASSIRTAVRSRDDGRSIELMLALAVLRLATR